MHVQADDLERRSLCGAAANLPRFADRDTELVGPEPGRDVGMAPRIDIRIDAERDLCPRLPRARDRIDAVQLAVRFGIDGLDAQINRLFQFSARFADPSEHDLWRNETGAECNV